MQPIYVTFNEGTTTQHNNIQHNDTKQCHYAERLVFYGYAERRYADCLVFIVTLSVVMLRGTAPQ